MAEKDYLVEDDSLLNRVSQRWGRFAYLAHTDWLSASCSCILERATHSIGLHLQNLTDPRHIPDSSFAELHEKSATADRRADCNPGMAILSR